MQEVARAIQDGANAYLKRQISTMIWFVLAITAILFLLYRPVYERVYPGEGLLLGAGIAVAFFLGVFASYGAGYVGMYMAVRGNLRTAAAALTSFKRALEIAFRAGAVSGMFTVGLGLLGATVIFLLFREKAMFVLVGFGFGGSLAALFTRVSGGIYTKGADVGADLVGKVEAGIPEDDPRNPATIADNVGDNVGDCAGMAVGRSAFEMIHEVRRQFREKPGIMQGTETPDYGRCVEIVTAAAQKELLGPGILAIALPAAVGFGLSIGASPVTIGGSQYVFTGAQALGGYLAGAILSGQLLAVLLANSGGAWDNAKKRIEDGFLGGKGTDAHKAGVIGDTVGDPFKDTAGPALNPLIKVMNLVAILIAPIVIQPLPDAVRIGVTAVAVGALLFSVYWSKRGSMAETIEHELGCHTTEEVDEYAPVGGKGGQ